MKSTILPLFLAGLVLTGGCMSTHLVKDKAQEHLEYDLAKQDMVKVKGQPGYYALLPFTVAGDVATSPVQFFHYLWMTDNSARSTMSIYGFPIPLK